MTLNLTVISETPTTLVLGHAQVAGAAGYRIKPVVVGGVVQQGQWAHSWDGTLTQHSFASGFPPYTVEALAVSESGTYTPPPPPPPSGAFVSDTFTDANGVLLQNHVGETAATWTKHPAGGTQSFKIQTNRVRGSSTGAAAVYYASGVPGSAEYDVEAEFVQVTNANDFGICGRMSPTALTMYVAYYSAGYGVELFKFVAGAQTLLGQYLFSAASATIKLELRDATKRVFVNGVQRITSPDNAIAASGMAGVRGKGGDSDTGVQLASFTATAASAPPPPPPTGSFTNLHRVLLGQGGITKQGVYRGLTDGSEKFYVAHAYRSDTGELVAIDPANSYSHIAYPFPASGEEGAWAMAYHAAEKNLYLGTYLNGHILRFNTTTQAFTDLGATGLQYVWDMTYSPFNQKVYACGSNSSKLFRIDGSSLVDLGTIDSSGGNQYARWMVADPDPANPYLYVGCGVNTAVLVAYNVNTGSKTVLSAGGSGSFTVDLTEAGEVWAYYGNTHLKCSGGTAAAFPTHPASPFDANRFSNGDHIDVSSGTTVITLAAGGTQTHSYAYAGKPMEMWRVGAGPGGKIYGSAAIPAWLTMLYDPSTPATQESRLGVLGPGQIYSFLVNGSSLWMSQYGASHVFMQLNPALPVSPDPFVPSGSSNPLTASGTSDWRPNSLINAPDGKLYSGTSGSYGQLSGRLIKIDPATRATTVLTPYTNQGVNGLATTPTAALGIAGSWALIGATTIEGGAGTSPSASTAELFTVNPATFQVVTKIPLPTSGIEDLAELVSDGTFMYCIGTDKTGTSKSYVFKYNHATNAFVGSGTLLPFTSLMYNTTVVYNGNIVGLCQQGIFSIPLANLSGGSVVNLPTWPAEHINSGAVFDAGTWYFTSGTELWEYVMP